jgi:hypothetical protein
LAANQTTTTATVAQQQQQQRQAKNINSVDRKTSENQDVLRRRQIVERLQSMTTTMMMKTMPTLTETTMTTK